MFQNLYIHVPFCSGKCSYCAFYSEPEASKASIDAWFERLRLNAAKRSGAGSCQFQTVYFGGGTPSCLPVEDMRRLFSLVRDSFEISPDAEISIECNPGSLDPDKAQAIASFANRVSVGVQSFDPERLGAIGRRGGGRKAVETAFALLRDAGLSNIGMDLMYALPGQSLDDWRRELDEAMALKPRHVSAYSLTIEEGSAIAKMDGLDVPDEDSAATMWEFAGDFLKRCGLPRYEISNYAAQEFECRHNQAVWHGQTYLGLGPAACSFDGSDRWTEASPLKAWLAGDAPSVDSLPAERRVAEILMMGLRTARGWTAGEFRKASGCGWDFLQDRLCGLAASGLLEFSREYVRPTQRGLLFWNSVAEELL